jgi:hypothetical protein
LVSESFLLVLASLFGISIVTNATPFFGASYTLIATGELVTSGFSLGNFLIIVLVTGLGATVAKGILYSGAFELRGELNKNKNVRLFHGWLRKRSFYLALFVAAFIPVLPLDDYIYIGAGANRAVLGPMLGITLLAKVAKSAFEIYVEFAGIINITHIEKSYLGLSALEFTILLSAVFIVLGIALYKLDWEKLLKRAGVIKPSNGASQSHVGP